MWDKDPKYEGKIKIMLILSPNDNKEISFKNMENLEDIGSYTIPSSTLKKFKAHSILGIFVSRFSIIQRSNGPLVTVIYDISEVRKSKITN